MSVIVQRPRLIPMVEVLGFLRAIDEQTLYSKEFSRLCILLFHRGQSKSHDHILRVEKLLDRSGGGGGALGEILQSAMVVLRIK